MLIYCLLFIWNGGLVTKYENHLKKGLVTTMGLATIAHTGLTLYGNRSDAQKAQLRYIHLFGKGCGGTI